MALPSSPPCLAFLDAPSSPLPELDDAAELPFHASSPITSGSRKRPYSDYGSGSSEPWFSDDTSDAGRDCTAQHPRKRLVKGPWWKLGPRGGSLRRKVMAKSERIHVYNDSGVWLGSDSSEDLPSTAFEAPSTRPTLADQQAEDTDLPSSPPPSSSPLSPGEAHAAAAVNDCVEHGREVVDLSNLALAHLADSTLRPLHQLIRHTHTDLTQPPSEDEFQILTPSVQMFLSGNALSALPSELFALENIAVLSLRYNELSNVPTAIGRLRKLKELNVAQNRIRWFPWEMLALFDCGDTHRQIITRPNPLLDPAPRFEEPVSLSRPNITPGEFREHLSRWGERDGAFFQQMKEWYSEDGEWTIRHELELKLKLGRLKRTNYLQEVSRAGAEVRTCCKEELIYLASSAIRYFNVDGSPYRDGSMHKATGEQGLYSAAVDPHINAPPASEHTAIPSLFELALRSMQATYDLQDPSDYPHRLPPSVASALQEAACAARSGNEKCSGCARDFIVARAEWMEYWFNGFPSQECLTPNTVLPFLRKACSWACATPTALGSFRT